MTGDYMPFTFLDRSSQTYHGFDVDMAEALGRALGVKVEYVQTAWPQLMKDFEADRFDIAMGGVSITLDRQKKGLFSTPIMREGKTPIARCTDVGRYQTLADIDRKGTRVIVNPGGTNERFARTHIKDAEIDVHGDNTTIFDLRTEKVFRFSGRSVSGFMDLYNIMNSNAEFRQLYVSGASFGFPSTIIPPRIIRFGAKLEW